MPLPVSGEKFIIIVTVSMYIQRKFSKHSAKIHIFADITCLENLSFFDFFLDIYLLQLCYLIQNNDYEGY